jgi:ABC-2 type transport system permease protein
VFVRADLLTYGLLARAGFRRQATYRTALLAGIFTNSVFGVLRASILIGAVTGAGAAVAGYDARAVSSYAWWGQVLIGSVALWGWSEIADRVRTGDIAADFLRPLPVHLSYLAADLGRGALALLVRGAPMLLIGALYSGVSFAAGPVEWLLGLASVALAVCVGFLGNYVVNCAAFWLVEIRGLTLAYGVIATLLAGLYVPVHWFPDWLRTVAGATPFPSLIQTPVDILSGYAAGPAAVRAVAVQVGWVLALGLGASMATAAGRRRLEVQGG